MAKKVISGGVSVSQLLEIIPDELLEEIALQVSADKWVKKLKASAVFKLVLFTLLNSERMSLRVMESNTRDPYFRSIYLELPRFGRHQVKHTLMIVGSI